MKALTLTTGSCVLLLTLSACNPVPDSNTRAPDNPATSHAESTEDTATDSDSHVLPQAGSSAGYAALQQISPI